MTGTPQAAPADAGEAPIAEADADAKIEELLSVDPASLGIDMSEPTDEVDEDDEDGSQPAPEKGKEQTENDDEEEEDPEADDDGDWDAKSEDEDDTGDGSEDAKGRYISDDGKVKMPDGSTTTIAALKQGSLLQEDYNRKVAELGQHAQQTQAMQAHLQQQYAQIEQQAQVAMQVVAALLPAEPDIRMAREDPVEYQQQKAEFDHIQGIMQQLMYQQQQVQEQQTQSTQQAEAANLGREVETFLAAEPALRDKAKWAKFRDEVMKVGGEKYGLQPEDMKDLNKAWILRALTDAMRYHRLKDTKPKTQKKVQGAKPKPRKGSKRTSSTEKQAAYRSGLTNALQKTGRKEVADRLLETLVS